MEKNILHDASVFTPVGGSREGALEQFPPPRLDCRINTKQNIYFGFITSFYEFLVIILVESVFSTILISHSHIGYGKI